MEEISKVPMISKKLWNTMKVVYFMLKKGLISKRKLMVDLNLIMKRGKIASKTLTKLIMLHHHQNNNDHDHDYEFSCENSPAFPFQLTKRSYYTHLFACSHAPPTQDNVDDVNAVQRVLAMLNANDDQTLAMEASSPPVFVRQVRVTDSPFPLNNVDGDHKVDEAAEEFIAKFYNKLKMQKILMSPTPSSW